MIARKIKYSGYVLLLFFCMMVIACRNDNDTEEWCEKKPYDEAAYDKSYDIYIEHFDDELNDLPRLNAIADSLYKSGDYSVQVNALMMKIIGYTITENNDSIEIAYRKALQIAKSNGHRVLYFSVYNNFCQALFEINASAAMRETKKMFDEANAVNSPTGRKNGHRMLGDIMQYYHNNSSQAIKEYRMAEAIADSMKSSPLYMFELNMSLATAYSSDGNIAEAERIMEKEKQSELLDDEYFQMSYNITRLGLLDKNGSVDDFNALYKKVISDSTASSRFTEDQLKDWKARQLIKNKEYDEAGKEIANIGKPEMRHARLTQLYEAKGDYKRAFEELGKLTDVRDSIRYVLNMNDIINMESQLHSAELKKVADKAVADRRLTLVITLSVLLIFIIASAAIFIHRQRVVNRRLKTVNDIKTKFMQNMSHELRTPINHVSGFAQLLGCGMCDDDRELHSQAVNAIVNGTSALTQMIENIMVIIDLENGNVALEKSDIDVRKLVAEEMESLTIDTEKNLQVSQNVDLPAGYTIKNNAVMIKHVISNLLSNAVKFTKEGNVTLDVYLEDDTLVFACTDTGCGIAPEYREAIFERFFKIDEYVPGTGLGLAVCRVIAESINGMVIIDDSYQGPGSRFVFCLNK